MERSEPIQKPARNYRSRLPWVSWNRRTRRNFLTGMAFISPWFIGFVAFTLYPMATSLYYSFTIYHPLKAAEWIWFDNYLEMIQDELFWKALANTLYMVAIGVPITLAGSFLCALLLNLKVRGQSIYRVIYFLPSIVPTVASIMLWVWIMNPQSGMVNTLLGNLGIDGPNWLSNPAWSKPALILLGLWGMGGTIVIYLSGLQDVPTSLMEAAELDGASWWQKLRHVVIPMISPITVFVLITGVIAMFQYFAQAYVFRGSHGLGYPLDSTLFYSVYLYQVAFLYLKMGYASAMAWILFIIIMICTVALLKLSERYTYYAN